MLFRPLSTPRLLLKNIGPEDEDFLLRQFSNEEVNRFLFDAEPFSTPADARELIAFYTAPEPRNRHRWVLVDRAAGEKLGTCGFHVWNREASACEMGYDLYPTHWHRGYMREALAAILAFARNDMGVQTGGPYCRRRRTRGLLPFRPLAGPSQRFSLTAIALRFLGAGLYNNGKKDGDFGCFSPTAKRKWTICGAKTSALAP